MHVRRDVHDAFHRLFSNMVPVEMIRHLISYWGGMQNGIRFLEVDVIATFEGARYRYRWSEQPLLQLPDTFVGRPCGTRLDFDRVFGKSGDVFDACVRVVQQWSPKGVYWRKVVLHAETARGERLEYIYYYNSQRKRRTR
mgnify:FL=1